MLRNDQSLTKQKKRPRGKPRSRSAPMVLLTNPCKKRKLWTEHQMCPAIEAVKGGMKVFTAAHEYDVPRMTLLRKGSTWKKSWTQPYLRNIKFQNFW